VCLTGLECVQDEELTDDVLSQDAFMDTFHVPEKSTENKKVQPMST